MPKSILYVYIGGSLGSKTSVTNKIEAQIEALNHCSGVTCNAIFCNSSHIVKSTPYITSLTSALVNRKYFKAYFRQKNNIKLVNNYIDENIAKYTHIYLRYPGASRELRSLTKKYQDKLVIEINGNLVRTHKNSFKRIRRVSDILHNLEFSIFPLYREIIFGRKIFGRARISSVSHELYKTYKKHYKIKKDNFFVVGNGIDCSSLPVRKYLRKDNEELSMLILKGASADADYLGIDRVLRGIAAYKGDKLLHLFIAGKHLDKEKALVEKLNISSKICFLGYLNKIDINKLVDSCDIAIGTLATYRSGINEISSLKTREYVTRGIPFILGYDDTDFIGKEEPKKFTLKINNDNSPVDMNKVIKYFEPILSNKNHPSAINKFALDHLSMKQKMKNLSNQL